MFTIRELLERGKKDFPSQPLLVDEKGTLTYLEAYEKAQSIASYLLKKHLLHQNILVPTDRSTLPVLLFWGIALSGNVYVPFSTGMPKDRIVDMIRIGDIAYSFDFSLDDLTSLSSQEALSSPIDEEGLESIEKRKKPSDPLYLMFTSGSTGKPKGILKSEENMMAFLDNFSLSFPAMPSHPKLCSQTPFYFDASAKDIYLTLLLEGTLYIPSKLVYSLPNKTVEYLNENHIDMILWVPSALINIAKIRLLKFMKPLYLRYIFFIGEVFPVKYLRMWMEALPETRFINWYGSTELSGACLYYEVKEKPTGDIIPLGKPLGHNEVQLEDGEICVSSLQVALGYLKEEEKTRLTFRKENGKIVLHTGDYATYDEEGNIVYSGRKDYLVKHLGYRIELQDIEKTLLTLPYIENCCALYERAKDRIVLFLSLSEERTVAEILSDSKKRLPSYMVPNRVRILSSLPYNANGKVDRARLARELEEK